MTRRVWWWVAESVVLLLVSTPLLAADSVLLSLNGSKSGAIAGEGPPGPYGNSIECFAYEQAATAPHDASGMATGKRIYQPITVRKRIDKTTPLIASVFVNNETVEAIFRFFRTGPGGQKVHAYTVTIKGGRIVARRDVVESTIATATASVPAYEEVSFVFKSIEWTWVDGGATAMDSETASAPQLSNRVRLPGGQ
jgi:type VI secretion system secreted protein Hcp